MRKWQILQSHHPLLQDDCRISFGVPKNNDDRISTEEHFADESILVHWLGLFLSFTSLGHLIVHRSISSCVTNAMEVIFYKKNHTSVHISLTFSRTMLQCLSKALTRPRSFLLFRQFINTYISKVELERIN